VLRRKELRGVQKRALEWTDAWESKAGAVM
jgi:hypothetical protein